MKDPKVIRLKEYAMPMILTSTRRRHKEVIADVQGSVKSIIDAMKEAHRESVPECVIATAVIEQALKEFRIE